MQREPVVKIFLKGLGYTFFGNILGGIMTISIAPFLDQWFIPYIAILFTLFMYVSLLFTAGLRDGQTEAKLLKNKRTESIPKLRWIWFGLILGAVMCIPCAVLLLGTSGALNITGEYLFAFRFICGAVCPAMYIAGVQALPVAEYPTIYPVILMIIYMVLTPLSAQIGYKFGREEKTLADFMYEKK